MISVIIPTYNHAKALPQCLDDVLAQQGVDVEILVIDDGSTDETSEILAAYGDRIIAIRQENAGAAQARNTGLAQARGTYVLFLDADARMDSSYLRKLREALETHPEASWAYSDFYYGWKYFHTGPYSLTKLKRRNYIHTSALIRRSHAIAFDPSIKRFQDWDLWLSLAEQGRQGLYVPGIVLRFADTVSGAPMSSWMPRCFYRWPFRMFPGIRSRVQAYENARSIIQAKHHLS